MRRSLTLQTGIIALVLAATLLVYAIPTWVSAPRSVPRLVLSPVFWPNILAVAMAICGVALVIAAGREKRAADPLAEPRSFGFGTIRLVLMAVLMAAYFVLIPKIGMPFASMLAFAGTAALMLARDRALVALSAITLPLLLYAFFAHVASVAIPQAPFFRLP